MRVFRSTSRSLTASVAALVVACSSDPATVVAPVLSLRDPAPLAQLVVSDPFLQPASATGSLASSMNAEIAYVSLPPGSLPDVITVTIRNVSTAAAASAPVVVTDAGFDPVPVVARADDQLELTTSGKDGAIVTYRMVVPKRQPPRVVRTSPPPGATDIAVNRQITVVFSEPISVSTLITANVRLLRGTSPVAGTLRGMMGNVLVEFEPDEELAGGTSYRLVITPAILDTDGDALEAEVVTQFTTQPTTTLAPGPFTSLAAGFAHTCALRSDGQAGCWGANYQGQLGAGNDLRAIGTCSVGTPTRTIFCSTRPIAVDGAHTFASLAAGGNSSCALTSGGAAYCWGYDSDQMGPSAEDYPTCDAPNGSCSCVMPNVSCTGVPVQVAGGLTFRSVAAGFTHACGIRSSSGVYCWGAELLVGGLGTGARITRTPSAVIGADRLTSISSGSHHICGLDAGGAAYCWGLNLAGQLGFAGGASCSGPTTASATWTWWCATTPTRLSGSPTFVALTTGWQHTCGLTATGQAYCWGDYLFAGSYGPTPRLVDDALTFVSLSTGSFASHTCGVTAANVAYCWGRNDLGQLGNGSIKSTLEPVRVAGDLRFITVVAGDGHSCALTTTGAVYCWGNNDVGQLGTGNTSSGALTPTRLVGQ